MLDPKEEAKFARLNNMCRELRVQPPPAIMIGLKVHDKNGVLTFDDVQRGHSWVRNFYNYMYRVTTQCPADNSGLFGAGKMSWKNSSGTIRSTTTEQFGFISVDNYIGRPDKGGIINNAADANYGIIIGTGDTAFSVEQYAAGTLIAHGNTASCLYYQAQIAGVNAYTSGSKTWKETLSRVFNNNSGGSITVKEVCLYARGLFCSGSADYVMLERSVLDPTVAVANGAQLTVTYEISMDFSAID